MWAYIFRRLMFGVPTLIGVTILVFIVMRIVPGDVAMMILSGGEGGGVPNQEDLARLREKLGLNEPLYVQYFDWMRGIVTFDFGARSSTTPP